MEPETSNPVMFFLKETFLEVLDLQKNCKDNSSHLLCMQLSTPYMLIGYVCLMN